GQREKQRPDALFYEYHTIAASDLAPTADRIQQQQQQRQPASHLIRQLLLECQALLRSHASAISREQAIGRCGAFIHHRASMCWQCRVSGHEASMVVVAAEMFLSGADGKAGSPAAAAAATRGGVPSKCGACPPPCA
ncbi:unnamed protein product, partial [Schistocephalus solidus]|uniref:Cyclin N-terminal domain-containing protein n=1 Tax=Schistocephalus solidus TaxID=70667 RepID=A0A183TCE4_SCHSO